MKTVYTTSNLSDAELVRVRLRNAGIPSTLDGANIGIRGPATPITVSVRNGDAARAGRVVQSGFRRRKGKASRSKTARRR